LLGPESEEARKNRREREKLRGAGTSVKKSQNHGGREKESRANLLAIPKVTTMNKGR